MSLKPASLTIPLNELLSPLITNLKSIQDVRKSYISVLKLNTEFLDSVFRKNVKTLANYLYVLRGCRKGHDADNWIEAENQLKSYLISDEEEKKSQDLPLSK